MRIRDVVPLQDDVSTGKQEKRQGSGAEQKEASRTARLRWRTSALIAPHQVE